MEITRLKIFNTISKGANGNIYSTIYDYLMVLIIIASLTPLMLTKPQAWTNIVEYTTVLFFIIDYIARWATADYLLGKGKWSFMLYPFTFMAIVDMLSILPCFTIMFDVFKVTRIIRLFRILRVFRIFRHSKRIKAFVNVMNTEKHVLLAVLFIALLYIFTTALILFNVEPHINPTTGEPTFNNFLDAIYWATVTLTTVGYGDLCPVTDAGRIISMFSAFFGIAIIALPSGIITAGYLDELRKIEEK